MTKLAPERRRLGIVYQHAYLFPHLTVRENVEDGAAMLGRARGGCRRPASALSRSTIYQRFRSAAASGNSSPSPARSPRGPRCCCSTSRSARSTLGRGVRRAANCARRTSKEDLQFCKSRTTSPKPASSATSPSCLIADRWFSRVTPADVFHRPVSPYIADFLGVENVFAGTARPIRAEAPGLLGRGEGPVRRASGRVHDRRVDLLRPRGRRARSRARGDPRRGGVAVGGTLDVVYAEPISWTHSGDRPGGRTEQGDRGGQRHPDRGRRDGTVGPGAVARGRTGDRRGVQGDCRSPLLIPVLETAFIAWVY